MKGLELIKNRSLIRNSGYLNGKFTFGRVEKGSLFDVCNPATGKTIMQLPRMTVTDAEDGAQIAHEAWVKWKTTTGFERSKYIGRMASLMHENSDDLAYILSAEAGKPFAEAKGEIAYATAFYEIYAEEAKRITGDVLSSPSQSRRLLTTKHSVGPAALITPWNFPSAMITRKVGPALAAGCTVVIKPAEQTPLSALALCAIAEEAGLPAGVMNCLTVARDEVVEVGGSLCNSNEIRKVSFTGSTPVGKWLMRECASTVKKVSFELGGNAPFIVFDDADLDVALQALLAAKFRNAGQVCVASNRILVQAGVYDKFSEMVAEVVAGLKCGDTIGPLIDGSGLAKVSSHVEDCVAKGAQLLTGGSVSELNATDGGFFYVPTVIAGVTKDMLPYQQETFGPVVPLIKFNTESEAVEMANDTDFGLAAYACTRDLSRAWRLADTLDAGMVGINEGAISTPHAPFGGVKQSGIGREGGSYGMEEYLETKFVCMGLEK